MNIQNILSILTFSILLYTSGAVASTTVTTDVTCSTKLGKSAVSPVPTTTKIKTSTQKAKITVTSTPVSVISESLATTQLSIVTIFDYYVTTTDYDNTLQSTTLTITPTVFTSTTTIYSISTTTETSYSTISAPTGWLPIDDTTSSVYPQRRKRSTRHQNARREVRPAPALKSTSLFPKIVACKCILLFPESESYIYTGSETVELLIESTKTITAKTTSTETVQPTSFSYLTITQFAVTTVNPASTTFTVTASSPFYAVSATTQVATLTAMLTVPTYAACSSSNQLSSISFANGTTGNPIAPSAMGNSTSLFIVSSGGGLNVDCCAECFSTLGCTGAYTFASMISPAVCYLWVDDEIAANGGICRQQDIFGAYQWEQPITVAENDGPYENLWNGPCGFLYLSGWNGK